jgi:hypothetical protein
MHYFDLIFTLHAQEQLKARGIKIADAWETFKHPNRSGKNKYGGFRFEKEFESYTVTVIAIQNNKNEWIVKSVWRNPELPGTEDSKRKAVWKKYNKSGLLGKIWIQVKQQLGISS